MPGTGALIATIISCAIGMCGVFYFSIASLRRELRAELTSLRTEFTTSINSLRTELKGEIATLRADMKSEFSMLRLEIATARTEEFKQKLAGAR
jgi:hypothetical protein